MKLSLLTNTPNIIISDEMLKWNKKCQILIETMRGLKIYAE